ncbi:MAG TPA: amidohydrolase family protein [Thermoanaerobaculia bacterium]|nr:amidohydrolase family protein [Thermoanaerobaculia bacterium]
MDHERVLRDQTVVVADGTIVAIGPARGVKVPAGALRVDATGRYLIPALSDMHVHLLGEAWNIMLPPDVQASTKDIPFESFLFPFVANGVTTVQSMSATPEELLVRERINRGELLGPRMILAPMIDGPKKAWPPPLSTWVASGAEAEGAVRRAKEQGFDKIKVYSFLSRESYDAIIATSREVNMDVIGHIPMALSLDYVLEAGQKLIAHSEEIAKHAGGDHSAAHIHDLAHRMSARGVWMTPTLVTTRSIMEIFTDPAALLGRPEAVYFGHPMQQGVWNFITENIYKPIPAAAQTKIRTDFETLQQPLTLSFHQQGGKMMTGTDTLFPGLVGGFAVHRELRELVGVGLTPYEALRTSTTNVFEYLGESEKAGTIEAGKQTDLLLLGANPLEDIAAVSRIEGVLIRGRWIGEEEIERRMQELAASNARKSLP